MKAERRTKKREPEVQMDIEDILNDQQQLEVVSEARIEEMRHPRKQEKKEAPVEIEIAQDLFQPPDIAVFKDQGQMQRKQNNAKIIASMQP